MTKSRKETHAWKIAARDDALQIKRGELRFLEMRSIDKMRSIFNENAPKLK